MTTIIPESPFVKFRFQEQVEISFNGGTMALVMRHYHVNNPYDPISGASVGACSGYQTMLTSLYRRCVTYGFKIKALIVQPTAQREHIVYMRAQDHTLPYGNTGMGIDTLQETRQRFVRKKLVLPLGHEQKEPLMLKMYINVKKLERVNQLTLDKYATTNAAGPPVGNAFLGIGVTWLHGNVINSGTVSDRINTQITYYCRLYGKRLLPA